MKIENAKKFLREFILTKHLYGLLSKIKNKKIREIKKNMKIHGIDTIHFVEKTLSGNVFFYMDMGTMLGIVREGRLLGHDLDIDIAVYAENDLEKNRVKELLLDAGCALRYTYYVEELGVVEHSFEINNLKFDINYYSRKASEDICYLMFREDGKEYKDDEMDVVRLSVSPINEVKKVDFYGKQVTIPVEAERYLAERYGDNWRIPDKGYVYWKGPSTTPTNYIGYQRKGYENESVNS